MQIRVKNRKENKKKKSISNMEISANQIVLRMNILYSLSRRMSNQRDAQSYIFDQSE